jgi:hypothetical protein
MAGPVGLGESHAPALGEDVGERVRVLRIRTGLQEVARRLAADPLRDGVANAPSQTSSTATCSGP